MEQMPSNMPVMDASPGVAGWPQVWRKAVTKPNEQTFVEISEGPTANNRTTFIWVFIAGTISAAAQAILQAIYVGTGSVPNYYQIPGLEQYMPPAGASGSIGSALLAVCLAPVGGFIYMIFFAIFAAIVQWIAKLFGGVGTFEKLAHAFASITVPLTMVTALLSLFTAVPFVGACFGIFSFGLAIYALVLQAMAVKGVNRFGWGQALGSLFIPFFVFVTFCCCLALGAASILGPMISNNFNGVPQFAP